MLADYLFFWWIAQAAAIAILVLLFLRWRPGFLGGKTIGESAGGALDAREQQIQIQLEAAQRSREEAARMHEAALQDVDRARQEAGQIVDRAGQTSQAIQEELQRRAREEYDRIIGQARTQIEYERERAVTALERRAADIVVDAAREVIERNLEPQTDRRIIDASLADLTELQ